MAALTWPKLAKECPCTYRNILVSGQCKYKDMRVKNGCFLMPKNNTREYECRLTGILLQACVSLVPVAVNQTSVVASCYGN